MKISSLKDPFRPPKNNKDTFAAEYGLGLIEVLNESGRGTPLGSQRDGWHALSRQQ